MAQTDKRVTTKDEKIMHYWVKKLIGPAGYPFTVVGFNLICMNMLCKLLWDEQSTTQEPNSSDREQMLNLDEDWNFFLFYRH